MRHIGIGLALCCMASSARAGLVIEPEGIDARRFAETGEIVLNADVLDDQGTPISGPLHKVEVYIDDQLVAGKVEVKTFREAHGTLALSAVLSAHKSYSAPAEPDGMPIRILDEEVKGFIGLLETLSEQDRVNALYFNEASVRPLAAWHSGPSRAIEALRGTLYDDERRTWPKLYAALERAVDGFDDDRAHVTMRRVLVVMSDGMDENYDDYAQRKVVLDRLVEKARHLGVEIIALGFTGGMPEPVVDLGALAIRTGGVSRPIVFDDFPRIAGRIAEIGELLSERRVIRFTPTTWRGSSSPVRIRVELATETGQRLVRQLDGVIIPMRAAASAAGDTSTPEGCGCEAGGESSLVASLLVAAWLTRRRFR